MTTTKELIQINRNEITGVETVNARDLHEFLEVGKDFSNWVKARIKKYGFVENADYVKLAKIGELSKTKQTSIEYHLTIEMSKELGMVENNSKGREIRQYFIAREKEALLRRSQTSNSIDKDEIIKIINDNNDRVIKSIMSTIPIIVNAILGGISTQQQKEEKIPQQNEEINLTKIKKHIKDIIASEAFYLNCEPYLLYSKLYKEFTRIHGIDIKELAKIDGISIISYAEDNGHLLELYEVTLTFFGIKKKSNTVLKFTNPNNKNGII